MYDHISRISLLIQSNKLDEAQIKITEALSEYPDSADLYALQAQVFGELDEDKKALEAVETALGLDSENAFLHYYRARFLTFLSNYKKALKSIDQAIEIDPEEADYYGQKALILFNMDKKKEAIEWARKGKEEEPDNSFCSNVLSMALGASGDTSQAEEVLGELLEDDPENAFTHTNMGYTWLRKGDVKKAKEHFREALLIDPEYEYARGGMMEAIKGSNFLYKKFIDYTIWMEKKTSGNRWAFLIGLVVVVKVIPLLIPFYLIFLLWVWFAEPIADVILYFDTYGRNLMNEEELLITRINIVLLFASLVGGLIAVPFISRAYIGVALSSFAALVPMHGIASRELLRNKVILALFAGAFIFLGVSASLLDLSGGDGSGYGAGLILAIIAYTGVGNIFKD